jgi:hypothetical protein
MDLLGYFEFNIARRWGFFSRVEKFLVFSGMVDGFFKKMRLYKVAE